MISEKEILNAYSLKCSKAEYQKCLGYLEFNSSNDLAFESKRLKVPIGTLRSWKNNEHIPRGIHTLIFLKSRGLIPYKTNARTARIIGYIHGDGFLNEGLNGFGFISSDLESLQKLKEDFEQEFGIELKLEEKRKQGEEAIILGKKIRSTKPTYRILSNNGAISCLLHALGSPKGRKVNTRFFVPSWIVEGNGEIKQGFLQGLFDAELSSPQVTNCGSHKQGITQLRLSLNKTKELLDNELGYMLQVARMLFDLGIECSRISVYQRTENPTVVLSIANSLKNLLAFAKAELFYYSQQKKRKTSEIKELVLQKNKRSKLFPVFEFISKKVKFTTEDLVKELAVSKSYSKSIGKYLYYCGFASRKLTDNGWFVYYPNKQKIKQVLDSEFPEITSIKQIILTKVGAKACDGHE